MDYQKHYDKLINRAKDRLLEGYVEKHHIIPRCMGDLNLINNLICLTPEEHYVAHQLLVKIYPDNLKLLHAAIMMGNTRKGNKLYGWLKKKHSEKFIPWNKGKTGLQVAWNKGRFTPEVTKQKQSESHKGNTNGKGNKGILKSEEWKKEHSEKMRGHVVLSETKQKIGNRNRGKIQSKETKLKRSDSLKGKPWSVVRRAAYERNKYGE